MNIILCVDDITIDNYVRTYYSRDGHRIIDGGWYTWMSDLTANLTQSASRFSRHQGGKMILQITPDSASPTTLITTAHMHYGSSAIFTPDVTVCSSRP